MTKSGKKAAKNYIGKIVIEGKSVAKGYFNEIKNTKQNFAKNKFVTNDLGYIDDDGFLFVTSRVDDIIISGGVNVNPDEIESAVLNHPAVKETAVFGIPDDYWGQAVICAVILKRNSKTGSAGIKKFLKNKIASYKIPKRIYIVKKLPKTELGKVKKSELRKILNLD